MKITKDEGWVQVSTAGGDVSFQKSGISWVRLMYTNGAAPTPTDVDDGVPFKLEDNDWRLLPAVTGKSTLWVEAYLGDVTVAVEDLA